jgi:murein L,D-transpeptidase YcbB/YkuD
MRWLHFGVPTKIMSAKLFSIVALSASALLNDSASRFPVATHPSTLSHFHSKKLRRQLTPQGVAHLRSELAALESMEIGENARAAHAREAQELYAALDDSLVWFGDTQPTAEALAIIEELKHADEIGLRVENYDGPLWDARLAAFTRSESPSETDAIDFDAALTISTMRFLSDLHLGRVNPRALHFQIATGDKSIDLSEFLRNQLIHTNDVHTVVQSVEPKFLAYRRTLQALHTYLGLARTDDGQVLPLPRKAIRAGETYSGVPRLAGLLQSLGDLGTLHKNARNLYDSELAQAVMRFQQRHGLEPNGHLDTRTLAELNTPLGRRVLQLQLTLERWRWLPQNFSQPPIVVNIPEFRVYAISEDHRVALAMNIVVGRAYHHETPVFTSDIQSVIFRPYWNVPLTIQRNELVPEIKKHPNYLTENSYEILDTRGHVIVNFEDNQEQVDKLRSGEWLLRQRPGPGNSLGLIKFELPNPYDVYLHGTPAPELFARSRRDFSHGCIRVEDPTALAVWILRGNPGWTEERIRSAMNGEDTLHVNLQKPIPAWILYGTAIVQEDGEVHFLKDIYGHDAALENALEQRNSRTTR